MGYPLGWFSGARPSSKVRLRDSYSGLFAGFLLAMGRSERPQNNGGKGFGRLIGIRLVLLGCFLAIRLSSSPAWAGFFRTGLFSAPFFLNQLYGPWSPYLFLLGREPVPSFLLFSRHCNRMMGPSVIFPPS